MAKFKVGRTYFTNGSVESVTIERRTEKTAWVTTQDGFSGYMRIRTDDAGDEYMTDSSVPRRWREVFTYYARKER